MTMFTCAKFRRDIDLSWVEITRDLALLVGTIRCFYIWFYYYYYYYYYCMCSKYYLNDSNGSAEFVMGTLHTSTVYDSGANLQSVG